MYVDDFEHEIGPGVSAQIHYSVDFAPTTSARDDPPEDDEFTINQVMIAVDLGKQEREIDILKLLSEGEVETLQEAAKEDYEAQMSEEDEPD